MIFVTYVSNLSLFEEDLSVELLKFEEQRENWQKKKILTYMIETHELKISEVGCEFSTSVASVLFSNLATCKKI